MASRYAPKGKEQVYEELCRVITREQGNGKRTWRKAMLILRRSSPNLVGLTAGATRAIYYWKYGEPAWVSAVPLTADGLQGENALLLRRGEDALDVLHDIDFAWVHEDYEKYG